MPQIKNPKMAEDWKNSKIRALSSSLKYFKGANVQYAYDKQDQIYSVVANFDGRPLILTLKVGQEGMEMMLNDKYGNLLEHVSQNGEEVQFTKTA